VRIRINDQKLGKNLQLKKIVSKTAIFLSIGILKGSPIYMRSLQPSKENIQLFKALNFFTFFLFCGSFLPPGSGSAFPVRIRIQSTKINAGPYGTAFATLLYCYYTING
jgi:hypothetical protein